MAKTSASKSARKSAAAKPRAKAAITTTVRKTIVPKAEPKLELTHDRIAMRAFEIYASGRGGSEFENWCRAERELRAEHSA